MNAVCAAEKRHQSLSTWAVSSGSLSQRMWDARWAAKRPSIETVWLALMRSTASPATRGVNSDSVSSLNGPAVGDLVELEVQRPHLTGVLRRQPVGTVDSPRHRRLRDGLARCGGRSLG